MSHDTLRLTTLCGAAFFLILGVSLGGCAGGVAFNHQVGLKAGLDVQPYDRAADRRRLIQLIEGN